MFAIKEISPARVFLIGHAPLLRMHQEPETQNHPKHQGGLYPWKFGTFCSAHRTVTRSRHRGVSYPVAGLGYLSRVTPDADYILSRGCRTNHPDHQATNLVMLSESF